MVFGQGGHDLWVTDDEGWVDTLVLDVFSDELKSVRSNPEYIWLNVLCLEVERWSWVRYSRHCASGQLHPEQTT